MTRRDSASLQLPLNRDGRAPRGAAAAEPSAQSAEAAEAVPARLDPTAALRTLLARERPPRGLAEDALLGWLIALPDAVDPAEAARELTALPALEAARRGGRHGTAPAEAGRLVELLAQVAASPSAALSRRRGRG